MRVLITRPAEDAEETARALAARGHEALSAPVLRTEFFDGPPVALTPFRAVLATSANGVRALARRSTGRDLPLLAVGPQTAAQARAAGFADVRDADGDADALAAAVARWLTPGDGPLLHVVGTGNDGKLAQRLSGQGYSVTRETLYAVQPVAVLPEPAKAAIQAGTVQAALFFSPRSAQVFAGLLAAAGLDGQGLLAACISPAAAAPLARSGFDRVLAAAAPNQDGLLDLLA